MDQDLPAYNAFYSKNDEVLEKHFIFQGNPNEVTSSNNNNFQNDFTPGYVNNHDHADNIVHHQAYNGDNLNIDHSGNHLMNNNFVLDSRSLHNLNNNVHGNLNNINHNLNNINHNLNNINNNVNNPNNFIHSVNGNLGNNIMPNMNNLNNNLNNNFNNNLNSHVPHIEVVVATNSGCHKCHGTGYKFSKKKGIKAICVYCNTKNLPTGVVILPSHHRTWCFCLKMGKTGKKKCKCDKRVCNIF
jgi:hypothetical protein